MQYSRSFKRVDCTLLVLNGFLLLGQRGNETITKEAEHAQSRAF
jgi:hypothetical protein